MRITKNNYHEEKEHLSSSFVKQFIKCEARALYERENGTEDKTCFKEGRLFECLLTDSKKEKEKFVLGNPDMFSSTGKTKGQLKSNYRNVVAAVEAVKRQKFLMKIIRSSKKQKIFLGEINGVPMKIMCDLLCEDGSIYDLKCMANFEDKYNVEKGCYEPWYECYLYNVQMYIYKEIAKQNGIDVKNVGLIAASKETVPSIYPVQFSDDYLEIAKSQTYLALERYKQIKAGEAEPLRCEHCEYCRSTQEVNEFYVV